MVRWAIEGENRPSVFTRQGDDNDDAGDEDINDKNDEHMDDNNYLNFTEHDFGYLNYSINPSITSLNVYHIDTIHTITNNNNNNISNEHLQ